jgi:hypothetical protein
MPSLLNYLFNIFFQNILVQKTKDEKSKTIKIREYLLWLYLGTKIVHKILRSLWRGKRQKIFPILQPSIYLAIIDVWKNPNVTQFLRDLRTYFFWNYLYNMTFYIILTRILKMNRWSISTTTLRREKNFIQIYNMITK